MKKSSLVNLAKGTSSTPAKKVEPVVVKKAIVEKPKTPDEERDIKARKKVAELIQSVETDFLPKTEESTIVPVQNNDGGEWLEDQVTLLSEQAEKLREELAQSKDDYTRIYNESHNQNYANPNNLLSETVTQNILTMFKELENNVLGNNPERTCWETIDVKYLLNQMIQLFPFLEKHRRF